MTTSSVSERPGLPARADVAVIGPGRAGTALAAALVRYGHRVVAVAGGSDASVTAFTRRVAGVRPQTPAEAAARADLVLVTTPDDAVEQVVTDLAVADVLSERHHVVHVAGSLGLAPLRRAALAGARVAACHPAQTMPSGAPDPDALVGAAWAVTAAPADLGWAHELVTQLGGIPHDVGDDERTIYHAALTLGSNAVAAAVAVARSLLLAARVDDPRAFLGPLVDASADNVLTAGAEAITGPVVRGDVGTIRRHLDQLDADLPSLADAYRHLSSAVLDQVRASLPPERANELRQLLDKESP